MITLSGYRINSILYTGNEIEIYRGQRIKDNQPVIIKMLKNDYPSQNQISKLRHEYQILSSLNEPEIIQAIELVETRNLPALILADIDGISLKQWLANNDLDLSQFLKIALQIVKALKKIHQHKIIHKDIKPSNIIINNETETIQVIDFSIASLLTKENLNPILSNSLEGTLHYMSPEQTGRMNREIDYRSDFYSLGVTFYQMLTKQLPYKGNDLSSLVHAHLAKDAVAPHYLKQDIPLILSEIILKLLAKIPEERYQSALGIQRDLEKCLLQLKATGKMQKFPLSEDDKPTELQISQKLYGREEEIKIILETFTKIANSSNKQGIELLLVSGYSGIGKSSLVHEIQKEIVKHSGYFIEGKFDQYKRNIPYYSFAKAFQNLIEQILMEPEENIKVWQEKLQQAWGDNGQVMIEFIPELELIIGSQPPLVKLETHEEENRFNLVFQQFIRVFSSSENPLVLFLDDLQWIDGASLKLIELLNTNLEINHLLLIGAYRDNEVDNTHPLITTLENIRKTGNLFQVIKLRNLLLSDVNNLLSDSLKLGSDQTQSLAKILFEKTNGNPFFLKILIKELESENILQLDSLQGWRWSIDEILKRNITNNVVELMIGKIKKLPKTTQKVLSLAACIGNVFDLKILKIVNQKSLNETARELWNALKYGIVIPLSNNYKIPLLLSNQEQLEENYSIKYKFLHDKVQQAAYALIPDEQKKPLHLNIGRLLWDYADKIYLKENIFDLTSHFNLGKELISETAEKEKLICLNLRVAKKAKAATAYEPALKYLEEGISLLAPNSWEVNYKLTLKIYTEIVEVLYLNTDYQKAEIFANTVLDKAQEALDKVNIFYTKISFYIAQNEMQLALDAGREILALLGVNFPSNRNQENDREIEQIANSFRDLDIESLINLPTLTDPYQIASLRIMIILIPPAYIAFPYLYPFLVLKMSNICLENGNNKLAPYVYTQYAMYLCQNEKYLDIGYRFGQLGLRLLEKFNAQEMKAKIYETFNYFIAPWREHLSVTESRFLDGFQAGIELGDLEYAGYAACFNCTNLLFSGANLNYVLNQHQKYWQKINKMRQFFQENHIAISQKLVIKLIFSQPEEAVHLLGANFKEQELLANLISSNNQMLLYELYTINTIIDYLFRRHKQSIKNAELAQGVYQGGIGTIYSAEHNWYYSLALLADYAQVEPEKQLEYLNQVADNQEKMKCWSDYAPMNFLHKYHLVEAEKARVLGDSLKAMELYDLAISGARDNNYIQEEAIAYEKATDFYLALGRTQIAEIYGKKTYWCYQQWGAQAKIKDLKQKYPKLQIRSITSTSSIDATISSSSLGNNLLDLNTIIKASHSLAQEIVLPKLLIQLMQIVMQNAGAETGCLILPTKLVDLEQENWLIQASAKINEEKVEVLQAIPLSSKVISLGIINYVMRTQKNIVLDDASNQGQFTRDVYILAHQPKSVLCTPLIHQGKLNGILYLENNLTTAAFTSDRLELLKLLSSQLATSLENAQLYQQLQNLNHNLEQLVAKRTQELSSTLESLHSTQSQLVESEKMAALGGLVAGVAHEINTPMGIGVTAASLLAQKAKDFFEIYKSGQVKRSQLENFLDLAIESSSMILTNLTRAADLIQSFKLVAVDQSSELRRFFNFKEYVTEILLSLKNKLKQTKHTVTLIGEDNLILNSYPGAFSQILTNLILNSLLHAYQQEEAGEIIIHFLEKQENFWLEYSDDGKGIAAEELDKIFEPFFTTKRSQGGTGLGLHIVYNLVTQKLGGTINCDSKIGIGTKFRIKIPLDNNN